MVADDPNTPKDITIEYAQDVPSLPDYVVIDRTYREMKANANPIEIQAPKSTTDAPVDKRALRLEYL